MTDSGRIHRRDFLTGLGAAGTALGYSVVVNASDLPPSTEGGPNGKDVERHFESIAPPGESRDRLEGEPNMRLVDLEADFFVAGGGMAGVCAALSAARHGARVILAQDRSRLGGNASSEVRMHIVGADHSGSRRGWREGGLIEELRLENAARNPHCAWELWDLMLYDKIVSEPNITLLLDSSLCAAEVEDGTIQRVLVRSDKTEHLYRIQAKYYSDCTGDSRLALEAGASFRWGHEPRDEFDEPLASEEGGPETLGSSLLFTSRDYGQPIPFRPPTWARKVSEEHLELRHHGSWEYGYWWIEWGGEINTIRDNERIRFELLSIALGVWDHIKNSGDHPTSENWGMNWLGMIPGKRENRRIEGDHILTQRDLLGENGDFEDAVAIGGWPFDDHPPNGFDHPDVRPSRSIKIEDVYNIPLRSLYSKDISNLFMAGRNISASHVAFTSTRVMATCSVEGQAVGTTVASCLRHGISPRELVADKTKLAELQQILLRDDQTIKHRRNEDPLDLARTAKVVASGVVEHSNPEHIVNGYVRDVPGSWGNRWGCDMTDEGAWIELQWDKPQKIRHIQILLDSGFHRPLTLTEQVGYRKRMVTDVQPELVKDYAIRYRMPGEEGLTDLVQVADNQQRMNRHDFDPIETDRIRLHVSATNGNEQARVYEIRCYA